MLTEIFGHPIVCVEGEIVETGTDFQNYATTTTTIYKYPNNYFDRTETNTTYSSHTTSIFHLRNDTTKVTKSVRVSFPKLNSKVGNYVRVFSAGSYNFALADDTTKTLFLETFMYFEELNRSRYWLVWLSVPLILLLGFSSGFLGGLLGAISIPFLMLLRNYSVRWTLWQSRSEFKQEFEGYKVKYRWAWG